MAKGLLAAVTPAANTITLLYNVPSGGSPAIEVVSCRFKAANTDTARASLFRLYRTTSAGSLYTAAQLYIPETTLFTEYAQARILLKAGEQLACWSDSGTVNFFLEGFEE